MPVTAIPRTIIKASLQGIRLPLTAVERISGKTGSQSWPPALVYRSFEAQAKSVLGSLIRDPELVNEGRLQRAATDELARAERLQAQADQRRLKADTDLDARVQAAEDRRQRVEEHVEQRKRELERETALREQQVASEARRRQAAAQQAQGERDQAVTANERAARRTRIAQESAALREQSGALAATRKAQTTARALDAKRNTRKSR